MNQIVEKIVKSVPLSEANIGSIEPVFLTEKQQLELCSVTVLSEHAAHKITRNKNDLRTHVQRIQIFIKEQQTEATYSALVDLFLVLKSNGLALRKRMLANARSTLTTQQFTALKMLLLDGLNTESDVPYAKLTLLTQGRMVEPHQDFIQKITAKTEVAISPIEEAMSYIQHGQLEQAQATLQIAILHNPRQLELHYDLLEIFNKTEDKVQFSFCYKQLLEHNIVLPPQWREMAHRFKVEV